MSWRLELENLVDCMLESGYRPEDVRDIVNSAIAHYQKCSAPDYDPDAD